MLLYPKDKVTAVENNNLIRTKTEAGNGFSLFLKVCKHGAEATCSGRVCRCVKQQQGTVVRF